MSDKDKYSYKVEITYTNDEINSFVEEFHSNNIEFTMNQYQRNRKPFDWSVIE